MPDEGEHAISMQKQVSIPDSKNFKPPIGQCGIPNTIVSAIRMLTAVQFDNQLSFEANEVGNVSSDGNLAAELEAN